MNYVVTEQGDLGLGLTPIEERERTESEEKERFPRKTAEERE